MNAIQKRCFNSGMLHFQKAWEDLTCSNGPYPSVRQQEQVRAIIEEACNKIKKL